MKLIKICFASLALLIACPQAAEAQLFNKLKEKVEQKGKEIKDKAEEKVKQKGKDLQRKGENYVNDKVNRKVDDLTNKGIDYVEGKTKKDSKTEAASSSGVGRTVGNAKSKDATSGQNYISDEKGKEWGDRGYTPTEEELNIMPVAEGVHAATSGEDFTKERNAFRTPKQTSSTIHIILEDIYGASFSDFYDGVAYIKDGTHCFYIDEKGEVLFDSYQKTNDENVMPRFYKGRVLEQPDHVFGQKDKLVIRDKTGKTVKSFDMRYASPYFVDGVAAIVIPSTTEKFGSELRYIDIDGNYVLDNLAQTLPSGCTIPNFATFVRHESEGLVAFAKVDTDALVLKWGFRDRSGKVIVEPKYAGVGDFHDGMAAFFVAASGSRDGKWGFIDKSGREVIPASFSIAPSNFDSGFARVESRNDDYYLIDKTGKKCHGPFGRSSNDGEINYITPLADGLLIGSTRYEGYGRPISVLYDKNFEKRGWGRLPDAQGANPLRFIEGELYYVVSNSTSRNVYWLNPDNMNLYNGVVLYNPYINGYSRFGKDGFVDKKFNYVIKFEKNEF